MVSLTSASNALKNVYLGVVANQLNVNANPLLGKIEQSTKDVWGKKIIKLLPKARIDIFQVRGNRRWRCIRKWNWNRSYRNAPEQRGFADHRRVS